MFSSVSAFNRLPKRFTPTNAQGWDYDAVGNWDSVTTNSVTQTRGANRQNEITSVSGATTPTYDNNGNLTKDENDYRFVYDAWNMMVQVKNSSNVVIVTMGRDALHRHVTDTVGTSVTDRFFSQAWQLLETKAGSNTVTRNVWSPAYVDAMVLRDRDTDSNGTLDERIYPLQDANWNTTGLVNTSGTVVERETYNPFGVATFRDAYGSVISASAKAWVFLHQGGEKIAAGNYEFRNRVLSPTLGRWLSNDPLGFDAGDANFYRYVENGPGNKVDPMGKEPPNGQSLIPPEFTWGSKIKIGPNLVPKIEPPKNPIIKELLPDIWNDWNDIYKNIKNGIDFDINGNLKNPGNFQITPSPGNNPDGISSDFGGGFKIGDHSGSFFGNIDNKGAGRFAGNLEGNIENDDLTLYYKFHMDIFPSFNPYNFGGTAGATYRNGPIDAGGSFTSNGTNNWFIEAYLRYYREFLRGGGFGIGVNMRHDVRPGNQGSTTINGEFKSAW